MDREKTHNPLASVATRIKSISRPIPITPLKEEGESNSVMLTSESEVIPIFDIYQSALVDYILYRACSKDAEYAPGLQLAQGYLATFVAAVGGKAQTEVSNDPVQALNPRNTSVPGSQS